MIDKKKTIPRYTLNINWSREIEATRDENGEWVKFQDIEDLIIDEKPKLDED